MSIQVPGIAEITSPQEGEILAGSVTIHGTAAHPSFVKYELAFGYSDDDTDTWFPIGDSVANPVQDGRLAIWDTTGITDGEYQLQLKVWSEQGEPLRVIVTGLQVTNYSPSPAATPAESQLEAPTPTGLALIPTATSTPQVEFPTTRGPNIGGSFLFGLILGSILLVGLILYIRFRADLRMRLAGLKTRRFHRRLDRDRTREGS
jgi:hypothetical protein